MRRVGNGNVSSAAVGRIFTQALEVIAEMIRESRVNRITGLAAEVTYFGVLSLFPGLLIVAGALGWLDSFVGHRIAEKSETTVVELLDLVLTERASFVIHAVRELFRSQSTGLLTTSALIAFLSLSSGFAAAIEALDLAYGVPERRSWISIRLMAFVFAVGSVVMLALLLLLIVAAPLLGGGAGLADQVGLGGVFSFAWDWLRAPIAFGLLVIWATTLYHLAPNRRVRWLRDLPGGVAAAVLWIVVSYGLRFYLQAAASANKILGVLGGGLILMIWFYLLSLVLLLGGELNAILTRRALRR